MAKRIDKIFEEIIHLSEHEQREFLSLLPKALNLAPEDLL
jgi:hypothetical protein